MAKVGVTTKWAVFLTFAAAIAVTVHAFGQGEKHQKESMMMSNQPTITHCFGRYLIDLPATAEFFGSTDRYAFTAIETERSSLAEFKDGLNTFEKKLRGTKHKSGSSLLVNSLRTGPESEIFAYWEQSSVTSAVDLTGFHWADGFRYRLHAVVDPERVEDGSKYMREVLEKIQPIGGELPFARGFCIEGALIADNDESEDEATSVHFRLKDKQDVTIDITTNRNDGTPPEKLLSRKPEVLSALSKLGASLSTLHELREGERTLSGVAGEEWLVRAPNDHKFQSHLFTWESPGLSDSTLHPQIRVELRTASYGPGHAPGAPSLTDEQAIELWDEILNSLKLRPTGDIKTADVATTPNLFRGAMAMAGQSCPVSGWWQCTDGLDKADISGGRVRFLRTGEPFPQALLLPHASTWQKIRGVQPTFLSEIPSSWKLVDRRRILRPSLSRRLAQPDSRQFPLGDGVMPLNNLSLPHADVSTGTQLSTGAMCIASGWWQCLEIGALDGTRWFAAGVILPPATKRKPLTILERMRGTADIVRVQANWQLMRLTDAKNALQALEGATSSVPSGGIGQTKRNSTDGA